MAAAAYPFIKKVGLQLPRRPVIICFLFPGITMRTSQESLMIKRMLMLGGTALTLAFCTLLIAQQFPRMPAP